MSSTNWKKGDIVEVTQDHNSVKAGTYVVARGGTKNPGYSINVFREGSSGQTFSVYTDHLIEGNVSVEDFEKKVKELESEIRIVKSKVEWMSNNGVEKYDELQFKVWNTLQIVKNEKDDIKAAKLISELF